MWSPVHELLCRQLVLTAADTAVADLPAGRMIQETVREISVAVHDEVPFPGPRLRRREGAGRVAARSAQPPLPTAGPAGTGRDHGIGGIRIRCPVRISALQLTPHTGP